jgi:hypothetical protein
MHKVMKNKIERLKVRETKLVSRGNKAAIKKIKK